MTKFYEQRKENDQQFFQLEEAKKKIGLLEKKIVFQSKQIENHLQNKLAQSSNYMIPIQTGGAIKFMSYGEMMNE